MLSRNSDPGSYTTLYRCGCEVMFYKDRFGQPFAVSGTHCGIYESIVRANRRIKSRETEAVRRGYDPYDDEQYKAWIDGVVEARRQDRIVRDGALKHLTDHYETNGEIVRVRANV